MIVQHIIEVIEKKNLWDCSKMWKGWDLKKIAGMLLESNSKGRGGENRSLGNCEGMV